jgi:NAD(P)H-dependent FMN reductase
MKLLFLSGSLRSDSYNKKLARIAANIAETLGAEVIYIDLKDYEMPLYDGDLESKSGVPNNAIKLKALMAECAGYFIASPEYNGSFSGVLKNAIDWISRPSKPGANDSLVAFHGKVAAISAASPGGLGGLRGLVPLRMLLGNIGSIVIPQQIAIASAGKAFAGNKLANDKQYAALEKVVTQFYDLASRA